MVYQHTHIYSLLIIIHDVISNLILGDLIGEHENISHLTLTKRNSI